MEILKNLKDFLTPKAFNKISYVAVICWIFYGVTLLVIFSGLENSESFRCEAKPEKMNLVQGKCSDQYKKQYNKFGIPVYGFVIANFSLIGIVCVIYSQFVKSRVPDEVEANRQQRADATTPLIQNNDDNRPKRRLFVAYFCQLATRFAIGIAFIVLQTQILYPDNFPSDFHCQIAAASHAANASSTSNIQKSTVYECYNQQATKKTSWMNAVIAGNGVLALIILIEIICILALRVKRGREFFEDSDFYRTFVLLQEQPSLDEYIESLKKRIKRGTEKPFDLKALFQRELGVGERNEDLKLDQIYTKLVLIPNRAKHDFSGNRRERLNAYSQSTETAQPISREEIIDGISKRILVVGRPGIGKTLFLTKWIRDWALGRAFSNFDFLFFLKFRTFNSDENPLSLRDLLSRSECFQYSETASETEPLSDQLWSHVLRNPKRVLIFFDGFDESSYRSRIASESFICYRVKRPMLLSALYYNLVEGNLLPEATILTTTRPHAMDELRSIPFDKTIEILGFASEQVKEYVESFAKDAAKDIQDAGKKIWEHIKTNLNILSLCYIPVNCLIICSCLLKVLKYNSEQGLADVGLPTKLTEIYLIFVQFFFYRQIGHRVRQENINSKCLPPEVENNIKPLTKLAFDGLTQKRLIFGQKEVPEDLVNCALLHRLPNKQVDAYTEEAQYCFIHLTLQEFLAAKHITDTMVGEELRTFVADRIKKGEWKLVLQFLAGLLGEQSIDVFTDLLGKETVEKDEVLVLMGNCTLKERKVICWPTRIEKYSTLTLVKCIQEINESGSVVQSKLKEIGLNGVDFSYLHLAPADCTAVVRFIRPVQQISHVHLSVNNIDSLGCVEIVKLFDDANCQLSGLDIGFNNIGDEGVQQLSNVLVKSQLSSLYLGFNNIGDEGVKHLSNVLEDSQLSMLHLGRSNITADGVQQLSNVLVKSQLSSLYLGFNNIGDEGVKHLSNVLEDSQLSMLHLRCSNITDEGVEQLRNVLLNNQKLRSLSLLENGQITNEAIEQLRQANPNCKVSF
ncbi:PREDICTED: nucleotide-binding oligomerization domain-containing protein 2-like isoform X2 [Acropora digitifera]|uniref:nucleotide-binding oligomerization domain-containing protein 2-like isoform X2 n=1 Tax=Acropora digitifera TaxID=70779 RepID=UPI00077A7B8C|nr:PREDICTED: nucleotide-binding oligomerization domain-containing protein 2-like isoform X2 [Acropora digitifera]